MRTRRRPAGLLIALAVAVAVWAAAAWLLTRGDPYPELPTHRAVAAREFRDSVGVNVHLSYFSTAYGRLAEVRSALKQLGVRHVRDGACAGCTSTHPRMLALARDGVAFTLIAGDPSNRTGTLEENLALVAGPLRRAVDGLEGPNEYDRSGDPGWVEALRAYQRELYGKAKGDARLRSLPVLAPSFADPGSRERVGDLSGFADFGNLHSYPGGNPPGDNLAEQRTLAKIVSAGDPLQATETGYHDALGSDSGNRPVDEATAGAYVPRLFLEYFRQGVRRTFLYELVDQRPEPGDRDAERHFGLLRADFSRKPAYTQLRALLAQAGDGGPGSGGPGGLAYALDVPRGAGQVESLLLQRGEDEFSLVLWRRARIWDPERGRRLSVSPETVTLRMGEKLRRAAVGDGPGSAEPRSIDVRLGAGPVVVRLSR